MGEQLGFFSAPRMNMHESIRLSLESLRAYLPRHRNLVVMFSGGKDSTAMLSFVLWAILTGQVPRPESVTVILADTRLELPPLLLAALQLLEEAREKGAEGGLVVETRVVVAPLDERILVYMLGRGVPPATNMTMRWCTRLAKGDPAQAALEEILGARGDVLILTGLREGESAVRDRRIATVCNSKGGECGAGLYQRTGERLNVATLAPLLHWRACHVWEWNGSWAPREEFGGFSTRLVATVYGVDSPDEKDLLEAVDDTARTGCAGCFCIEEDRATVRVVRLPGWGHFAPLLELKAIWRRLRRHDVRLRKPGGERRKDGKLAAKQHRIGPIILPARLDALAAVLDIQQRVNVAAVQLGRPGLDILNGEEEGRIRELIALNTWPEKWTGREKLATEPFEENGQRNFLVDDDEEAVGDALVTLGVRRG
ncbi:MAG: phosphoadenosine phosphosulfate reductase family protein [Deltaproteobacteria bacterium]|nr:phosphoadenosine phosphosulfate reductase family protein [Deltaproteobacteria bacterium]